MTARSVKTWYFVHKWTSLVSTAFLLLLCVTGLPLIFHHEIDHALGYSVDPPELESRIGPASVEEIVDRAGQRRPDEVMQFLVRDADEPNAWFVRMGTSPKSEDISSFLTFDARTGEFLNDYPLGEGIMNLFLRLHVDMFAGLPGTLFLGFMGILLVASLVSGTVLYGPFTSRVTFGTVRDRSPRVKWLDIHNVVGIVTLVWLLVVGMTGVVNTLSIPIFETWQSTELAEMVGPYRGDPRVAEVASEDRVLAAARRARPDMQLSFLAYPGNEFASPHHFTAFMQGRTAWSSKLLEPVLIDARTAEIVDTRNLPWYVTTLLVSQPLHFGDYGGLPLKVLWALLDLLSIVVLGTGLYLWLKRRRSSLDSLLRASREESAETPAPGRTAA